MTDLSPADTLTIGTALLGRTYAGQPIGIAPTTERAARRAGARAALLAVMAEAHNHAAHAGVTEPDACIWRAAQTVATRFGLNLTEVTE